LNFSIGISTVLGHNGGCWDDEFAAAADTYFLGVVGLIYSLARARWLLTLTGDISMDVDFALCEMLWFSLLCFSNAFEWVLL